MEKGLVSIITPCYNGETYLDRYFKSVLSQSYEKLELIFINDGSTDSTEKIVDKYRPLLEDRKIKLIYLKQENKGQASALNYGLKYFTGEYLTWPDADDEMTPDCISTKVEYMEKNPDCDLCICKIEKILENDENKCIEILERQKPVKETLFEDLIFLKNVFYVPGGYLARTNIIDRIIINREIYTGRGGQNPQILLPIASEGNIGYIDKILYRYYVREESHSHSVKSSIQIIRQMELFERILIETISRLERSDKEEYITKIRKHYSRLEYGNAIDSQNKEEIKKAYKNLKKYNKATLHEVLLYFKYGILK